MRFAAILLFTFLPFSNFAQDSCACCTPEHGQFHFWVGNWNVFDASDSLVGVNQIELLEDKCVMREIWSSTRGTYTGTSYNYYDTADSTWNQLWLDNQGGNLKLKGNPVGKQMILRSDVLDSEQGPYFHEITWTQNADGTVRQAWAMKKEDGTLISLAFDGLYKRAD